MPDNVFHLILNTLSLYTGCFFFSLPQAEWISVEIGLTTSLQCPLSLPAAPHMGYSSSQTKSSEISMEVVKFLQRCGGNQCHGPESIEAALTLIFLNLYNALIFRIT